MPASDERRLGAAWLVAVGVTLIYLAVDRVADTDGAPHASTAASVAAIAFALVKLRIIVREFMDVRRAPAVLRAATDALVIAMGALLLGTYAVASATA